MQLEWQCTQASIEPFTCNNKTNLCIYGGEVCDGQANCPNGEDEDLETCTKRGVFSEVATIVCPKKNIYNGTIWIWAIAIPCDGNYECEDDQDEKKCSVSDFVSIVILGIIMIISQLCAFILWKFTTESLIPKNDEMITLEDLEFLHGTDSLKTKMFEIQSFENAQNINSRLIEVEMKIHDGIKSEVVCCIKVSKSANVKITKVFD